MNSRTFRLGFVLALGIVATAAAHNQMARGRGGSGSAAATTPATAGVATSATLALYVGVDGGSDGNPCTDSAAPCLTIQGAVDKIPMVIAHPVTVDIAAGSYTGFRFYNHTIVPATSTPGAYVAIRGAAHSNVTPATGTATGTFTSVATDATVGFHVVTDSGATWTVNDFASRFLSLTSGTGIGQICPIISNTATAITVSCTFSPAPVAGTGYAITTPSTIINVSTATPIQSPAGGTGTTTPARGIIVGQLRQPRITVDSYVIQDIEVSGAFTSLNVVDAFKLYMRRLRIAPTGSSIGLQQNGVNTTRMENCYVASPTGIALNVSDNPGDFSDTSIVSSYVTSGVTSVANATVSVGRSSNVLSLLGAEIVNTSSTGNVVLSTSGGGVIQVRGTRLRCSAASTNVAFQANGVVSTGPNAFRQIDFNASSSIETCGTGLSINGLGLSATILSSVVFLSNTTAINAKGGAKVAFSGGVSTFTTNTTDLTLDGTNSTRATFVALTPNSMVDLNYLSAIYLLP